MKSSGSSKVLSEDKLRSFRPMNAIELVDNAINLCSQNILALFWIVFPLYLFLGGALVLSVSFAEIPPSGYSGGMGFYFLIGAIDISLLFISNIGLGAGVFYLYCAQAGIPVTPGKAFSRSLKKAGSLIFLAAVTYSLSFIAGMFVVLPGIAMFSAFAICVSVAMIEDVSSVVALKKGYSMLRDFLGRSFKAHLFFAVLLFMFFLSFHAMVHLGLALARSLFNMEAGLLSQAFSLGNLTYLTILLGLMLPGIAMLLSAMSVLLYTDVRVRTEGVDIERRIDLLTPLRQRSYEERKTPQISGRKVVD